MTIVRVGYSSRASLQRASAMALNPLFWLCLALVWESLGCIPLLPNGGDDWAGQPASNGTAADLQAENQRKMSAEALLDSLLDSLSRGFPTKEFLPVGVKLSCRELASIRDELDHILPSRILVDITLALALGGLGCRAEAEPPILQLYEDLGMDEVNEIFHEILVHLGDVSKHPVAASTNRSLEEVAGSALMFNIEQIADPFWNSGHVPSSHRCTDLIQVNGSLLVGSATSTHGSFVVAASACRSLGPSCAGIAHNSTGLFQVIWREGSYFLPCLAARSWLNHCEGAHHSLRRRSAPTHCQDQKEQEVHGVVQWLPMASTFYNLGTSVYYAVQNCTELAKERALETVIDLGYDAVVALTGGATGIVGYGVATGLKPGVKAGVRALVDYFRQTTTSAPR